MSHFIFLMETIGGDPLQKDFFNPNVTVHITTGNGGSVIPILYDDGLYICSCCFSHSINDEFYMINFSFCLKSLYFQSPYSPPSKDSFVEDCPGPDCGSIPGSRYQSTEYGYGRFVVHNSTHVEYVKQVALYSPTNISVLLSMQTPSLILHVPDNNVLNRYSQWRNSNSTLVDSFWIVQETHGAFPPQQQVSSQ